MPCSQCTAHINVTRWHKLEPISILNACHNFAQPFKISHVYIIYMYLHITRGSYFIWSRSEAKYGRLSPRKEFTLHFYSFVKEEEIDSRLLFEKMYSSMVAAAFFVLFAPTSQGFILSLSFRHLRHSSLWRFKF